MGYHQEFMGTLNRGYQGQIIYTFVLPETVQKLQITVAFDRLQPEDRGEAYEEACHRAVENNGGTWEALSEEKQNFLRNAAKAEINFAVFRDEQCLGTAHRNAKVKTAVISAVEASRGFLRTRVAGGFYRLVLECFNIVADDTHYSVLVEGTDSL
jgi:hypothetical protein